MWYFMKLLFIDTHVILQALGKRDIPTKLIEGEPSNTNQESLGDSFHPLVSRVAPMRPVEEHTTRTACQHPAHHR